MLLVDFRAGSDELREPLRKLGLPAERGDIAADIAFEGRGEGGAPVMVGIEFKKLSELVSSLRTNRLQGYQLLKMREAFQFCYLLIEGEFHYDAKGRLLKRTGRRDFRSMPGHMVVGELLKRLFVLHLRGGLNILFARTRQDSLQTLAALYRVWMDKALDQHDSHIAIYQAPTLAPISNLRRTFATFPGVGIRKSLVIEQHFKSLKRAVLATEKEWQTIDGIGAGLARQIVRAINDSA